MFKDVLSLPRKDYTIGSAIRGKLHLQKNSFLGQTTKKCVVNRGLGILELIEILIGARGYYFVCCWHKATAL